MGLYIEPKNGMSKKDFISKHRGELQEVTELHAKMLHRPSMLPKNKLLICLVDNGPFYALAVAFDDRELEDFTSITDLRPKTFYLIPTELVKKNTSNFDTYIKG